MAGKTLGNLSREELRKLETVASLGGVKIRDMNDGKFSLHKGKIFVGEILAGTTVQNAETIIFLAANIVE